MSLNRTGARLTKRRETAEGHELTLVTNVLGPNAWRVLANEVVARVEEAFRVPLEREPPRFR
jgi:hypothetical protein